MKSPKLKKSGFKELTIAGEKRYFKFGMLAFAKFCEIYDVELTELGKMMASGGKQLKSIIGIMYCAAQAGAETMGQEVNFTEADVYEWVDEMPQETFNEILETITTAKIMGQKVEAEIKGKKITESK